VFHSNPRATANISGTHLQQSEPFQLMTQLRNEGYKLRKQKASPVENPVNKELLRCLEW